MRRVRAVSLLLLFSALQWACSTPSPTKPVDPAERIQKETAFGANLAVRLEPVLKIRKEPEVQVYLSKLARELADAQPEMKSASVGVIMIHAVDSRWICLGLPGYRIYLPVELLRTIEYENELAAAIALQMGHVYKGHVLARMTHRDDSFPDFPIPNQIPEKLVYFGPGGLFSFTEEEETAASETAVEILYRAGFDPRGLVSLWRLYQQNLEHSPYDPTGLEKLADRTRDFIADYAPLRNPVVRSQAFLSIHRRIQRL